MRGTEESCCCWRCCCCIACRCRPAAISYSDDDAVGITIAITLIPFHYMTLHYMTFSTNHGPRPTISLPRSAAHGLQTLHTQLRCSSSTKRAPRIDLPYTSKPPGLPLHLSLHTATHLFARHLSALSLGDRIPTCHMFTPGHPCGPLHSRPRLHLANACIACIACIAFFPISHLPGSSRPLSHYPTASMLQADNVDNRRRRQRQRQRPSVQHPLSSCLPLRPSCLSTTTAELDTTKPALFIPLCMTSTQSHP
jgi:hypothetical protein